MYQAGVVGTLIHGHMMIKCQRFQNPLHAYPQPHSVTPGWNSEIIWNVKPGHSSPGCCRWNSPVPRPFRCWQSYSPPLCGRHCLDEPLSTPPFHCRRTGSSPDLALRDQSSADDSSYAAWRLQRVLALSCCSSGPWTPALGALFPVGSSPSYPHDTGSAVPFIHLRNVR